MEVQREWVAAIQTGQSARRAPNRRSAGLSESAEHARAAH